MAYANGDKMTATYNGVGQTVVHEVFDRTNVMLALNGNFQILR
jgi:hypothetical protein